MSKVLLKIDGEIKESVKFATRGAATRYAEKHGLSIVCFWAHEYYVA
jgi:hypothetical protein